MSNCTQACPYNTLNGCKVEAYGGICPLSNMATTKPMTNADRIRAMSDEDLAKLLYSIGEDQGLFSHFCCNTKRTVLCSDDCSGCIVEWLKQFVEEETNDTT